MRYGPSAANYYEGKAPVQARVSGPGGGRTGLRLYLALLAAGLVLFAVAGLPTEALAQEGAGPVDGADVPAQPDGTDRMQDNDLAGTDAEGGWGGIRTTLQGLLLPASALMFTVGLFVYGTAAGNQERIGLGGKIMGGALAGLVIGLFALGLDVLLQGWAGL